MNLVFTDEMNLFAPQSIQAKVELLMLSNLLNNVISPKDSSPVISLVQDTPIGLYYLSQEKELKWNDVTLLLSTTSKLDEILNGEIEYEKRSYSGNELISLFLPDGMNLKFGDIEIKNGKIKEGSILTGDIFKGKKGNILHYLSTAYDNAMYIEFVDNMQRISNMYLYVFHGFTIGINDFRVDEKINDVLIKERFQKVFEVENLLTNVEDNKIIDRETYEQIAYRELDSIKTNQASYVKERLTEKNNMHVMASLAKSKGKDSNIGFTMTCLGQCAFEGKLVQYTTNSRTLPYFSKNDDTPASRGFIFNNYSSGLKVSEFFYHNLDGRQGIIDTAIKSVVGDTELYIIENNEPMIIKIGDWIDKLLEDNISEINIDNSKNEYREELSLSKKTFVPTTDLDGNVSWGEITGITRHLPTEEMYEIETHGGRKVCVTDSHSLLIWNDEKQKLERLSPSVVKEGDKVPITGYLEDFSTHKQNIGDFVFTKQNAINLAHAIKTEYDLLKIYGFKDKTLLKPMFDFENKRLHPFILNANIEFIESFVNFIENNLSKDEINDIFDFTYDICLSRLKNNVSKHNDIVLDVIVKIRKKNGSEYNKVYDLTVPSTLNFGLANGLHVVDTGDTGYVQRKIIKAAEDIYVAYDNTLRNGVDEIVQFVYAGNGFDVVSLVETKCNLLRMNTKDLKKKYKEKKVLEYVLSLRSELLSIIFASNTDRRYIPEKFMIPFNLFHILSSCKSEKTSKYTATEIIDKIQKTLNPFDTKISAISKDDMMKYENINHYYLIMKFLLIDHLDLSKSHNKVYIDNVLEKIQYNIYKNIIQPGEMVGITSAQSIGEPLTQFTLNSVEWNTELLLKINGKLKVVKIGEWIDERIDNASKENLEYHKNDQTLEYIKDCKVEVLSADENGKVIWDNISAVTKHPVINKDKSRTLVKVTTDSGRVITATKGDSFLIRQNNKLMKYKGEDLKIGDYIPVANVFPSSNIKEWDFEEYIPKDEYVYMSEVNKALELKEKTKFWWSKHHKKDFVLPFKRGDTFYDACKIKYLNQNKKEYFQNKIYPKHGTIQSGHIPEKFELDNLFGFFLGAYLAEGHCTQYQVLISNCDNDYMDRIIMFCDQHSLKYHFNEGTRPKGYSRTIRIHSLILAQLFMKACGKTSDEKHVPTELLDTNEDFLKGLIDGYISGDGCVHKSGRIDAGSISKSLLDDIQVILARFSIFSRIVAKQNALEYNLKRGLKARLGYELTLSQAESYHFKNHFTLTVKNKQERLNEMKSTYKYGLKDMIPDIETEQFGKITIQRKKLDSYIEKCNNENDLQIFENIKNENIKYDKIVNIEEVVSDHFYVYDVTADKTKNFCTRSLIAQNDTFHSTGSSSAVGGMDGIKRFLEIINITKNQKVPITTIYMTEEYRYEKKNAEILSKKLKYVKFEDLIESYDIIYDETKERMKQDKIVENTKLFLDKDIKASNINPYTFRMVLSKESLYEENVELIDIKLAILKFFEECNLKITKKRYKTLFANLENVLILSNSIHDEEIIIHVRLKINEDVVDLETLKIIFDIFLKEIHIKGLPGIELVSFEDRKIHELDASENIVEKTEYVILTKGINLNELFLLHGIDKERTITNDIQITYRYYGIEAARQLFIKEIMKVFEMGGHSLNQHHLTIIGDLVTKNGILTSVNRYGLNKLDNDPLSKASFEQTMTELIKASIYEDKDYLRSVSSRIMTGKTIKGGTGLIDIILDIDKLQSINFDKSNSNYPEDIEIVSDSENDSDSDDESGKFVESDVFKNL